MCGGKANFTPAQNGAHCWGIACMVLGILGCLNFIGTYGFIGGVSGCLMVRAQKTVDPL